MAYSKAWVDHGGQLEEVGRLQRRRGVGNFRMIPLWHAECWRRMIQPGLDVDGTGRWNVLHSFHVRAHGVSDAPLFFSSSSIVGFGNHTAVYSAKVFNDALLSERMLGMILSTRLSVVCPMHATLCLF